MGSRSGRRKEKYKGKTRKERRVILDLKRIFYTCKIGGCSARGFSIGMAAAVCVPSGCNMLQEKPIVQLRGGRRAA